MQNINYYIFVNNDVFYIFTRIFVINLTQKHNDAFKIAMDVPKRAGKGGRWAAAPPWTKAAISKPFLPPMHLDGQLYVYSEKLFYLHE